MLRRICDRDEGEGRSILVLVAPGGIKVHNPHTMTHEVLKGPCRLDSDAEQEAFGENNEFLVAAY